MERKTTYSFLDKNGSPVVMPEATPEQKEVVARILSLTNAVGTDLVVFRENTQKHEVVHHTDPTHFVD